MRALLYCLGLWEVQDTDEGSPVMFRVEGDTGERRELIAVMFKVAEEVVEGGTGYR